MKRWTIALLTLLLSAALCCTATAAQVHVDDYSDTPATPTQENVLEIRAEQPAAKAAEIALTLETMAPTALTVDTLSEIFDFVDIDQNPPARYFPEDVQAEIEAIIDADPDILHMPEFFSLLPQHAAPHASAIVDMRFDIDYEPGRLVVVVLGVMTEDGLLWKPLKADVVDWSLIRFEIPEDVLGAVAGHETIFALLTVRPGSGWHRENATIEQGQSEETRKEPRFVFSKSFEDVTRVEHSYMIVDGEALGGSDGGEDCQIILVEETQPIEDERLRLTEWLAGEGNALMPYFDAEINRQAALYLPDTQLSALVAYELANVMVVGYDEPFGDVAAYFSFVTPYEAGQPMLSLLGLPQEDGTMAFTPLHTEYVDGLIEITFSSTVLPAMMKDAGMLLVLSTPME